MKVLVVGAGAIGLSSAYYLASQGADVTIVEAAEVGAGASRRNAGWIVPSMARPVPAPGLVLTALKWLSRRDSPFYIRARPSTGFVRFLFAMLRNCNQASYRRGAEHLVQLAARAIERYDQLEGAGVIKGLERTGIVQLFLSHKVYADHIADLDMIQEFADTAYHALDNAAVQARVPGISSTVAGGIDCPDDRYLNPNELVDQLAAACRRLGVDIVENEPIASLDGSSAHRPGATGSRRWRADWLVVAAGVWSRRLLQPLLGEVPIYAGKGYGFDVSRDESAPTHSLYLSERKVAITSFADHIRISGSMGIGPVDGSISRVRAYGILKGCQPYLPGWRPKPVDRPWMGLRPMTPDGLPIIGLGAPEHPRILVAAGHAMLGITLATATGELISRFICDSEGPSDPLLSAFSLNRFHQDQ